MVPIYQRLAVPILLVVGLLFGPTAHSAGQDGVFHKAVLTKYALKQQAFRTGNAALLRDHFYAADVVLLGEGVAPIVGGNAVFEAYSQLLPKRRNIKLVPMRSSVSVDGTMAYDFVLATPTASDPAVKLPSETILFVWRKEGDDWRCVVEMFVAKEYSLPPLVSGK